MAESTGGGTAVGGGVGAGKDFIGRDHVEIHGAAPGQRRVEEYSDGEILRNLHRAIIGNPYNAAEPGLLFTTASLAAAVQDIILKQKTADTERAELGTAIKINQELIVKSYRELHILLWWLIVGILALAGAVVWLFLMYGGG